MAEGLFNRLVEIGCPACKGELLSRHTTFKIGGPSDLFIMPQNVLQLKQVIQFCQNDTIPVTVIGNGSNLLVADEGVRGAVIHIGSEMGRISRIGESTLCSEAGVPLSRLCQAALREGLSGLEFAWGIPGTVGGAAYMNAGAYGGEMRQVVQRCEHIEPDGSMGELDRGALDFAYRHSAYTGTDRIITSVTVELTPDDPARIQARMEDFMTRRKEKQPLEYPSAGSIFKRPEGYFAGKLIADCGLKGFSVGGAQVSDKHAGFIINKGGATCSEVTELISIIQRTVLERFGVSLECEIRRIG